MLSNIFREFRKGFFQVSFFTRRSVTYRMRREKISIKWATGFGVEFFWSALSIFFVNSVCYQHSHVKMLFHKVGTNFQLIFWHCSQRFSTAFQICLKEIAFRLWHVIDDWDSCFHLTKQWVCSILHLQMLETFFHSIFFDKYKHHDFHLQK